MPTPIRFAHKNQTQHLALKAQCTNEFQELPVMLLWEVSPQLRERIRELREMCKLGSDINQIRLDADFKPVEALPDDLDEWGERVLVEELVAVPKAQAARIDELDDASGIRGEAIVVTDSYVWLTCYDKWTEQIIESGLVNLNDFLGESPGKRVA